MIENYSATDLPSLCTKIRKRIIDVMSQNGGHLASNLGSIELTVALHHLFSSPTDKFLFDVSHQTYAHKILTGRDEKFDTVRKYDGLCGFSHPGESDHDHFHMGHAGTALPLALGLAKARDLAERDEYIIPVIGDATLTCGLTFEALNNIPKDLKNFIIILNDNKMSISKNVGAITDILSPEHAQCSDFLAENERPVAAPTNSATFFGHYNLNYFGPFDGHNIEGIVKSLEAIKAIDGPVLLHLKTVKGHGMEIAAENPTKYHGVKPFDPITGLFHKASGKKSPSFPQVFGQEIVAMAEERDDLVAVTPAMPAGACLTEMMNKFPERCLDVGIAEGYAVTYAAGIAKEENNPVIVSIYSTFLQRAVDSLYHDVCLQEIPLIFALDRSGIAGGDGATHNGIYDIGLFNNMPNMVIAQPRNGKILRELLRSSLEWKKPCVIRYPNLPTSDQRPEVFRNIGKGELIRKGEEIAIFALGHKVETALEVAQLLQEKGISPTVVDPVFIKPFDLDLLERILLTHKTIVTIEEHVITTGLGSIINDLIAGMAIDGVKTYNYAIPETFVEHGDHNNLTKEVGLDAHTIADSLLSTLTLAQAP